MTRLVPNPASFQTSAEFQLGAVEREPAAVFLNGLDPELARQRRGRGTDSAGEPRHNEFEELATVRLEALDRKPIQGAFSTAWTRSPPGGAAADSEGPTAWVKSEHSPATASSA